MNKDTFRLIVKVILIFFLMPLLLLITLPVYVISTVFNLEHYRDFINSLEELITNIKL